MKRQSDDIAVFWRLGNQAAANHRRRFVGFGSGAEFREDFRREVGRDFVSEVEAGKNFELGVNDVLAALIRRFDPGIVGADLADRGTTIFDYVADEKLGLGLIWARPKKWQYQGGGDPDAADGYDFPFVPKKDVINVPDGQTGRSSGG